MSRFGKFNSDSNDPYEVIEQGYETAISTMETMIVNEGQRSVLENTVIPKFELNASASPISGWTDVSCSPYCSFMSQTTETGNAIMRSAYQIAFIVYIKNLIPFF